MEMKAERKERKKGQPGVSVTLGNPINSFLK
jgi:hypothetical protein